MAQQVKDPVCGMMVDPRSAAAQTGFEAHTYYFCSSACLDRFEKDPARYASAASAAQGEAGGTAVTGQADAPLEKHEPPFTKSGGMVAPKFGAAGSGGLEYERLPEAHDPQKPS